MTRLLVVVPASEVTPEDKLIIANDYAPMGLLESMPTTADVFSVYPAGEDVTAISSSGGQAMLPSLMLVSVLRKTH